MSELPHPLVSIVIPTFDQGQYLPACIDHCLFQTYPELEIIIIDGGSTDSTKSYLKTLEQRIPAMTATPVGRMDANGELQRNQVQCYPQNRKLKILSFEHDIGPTRTYNEGLKRVQGKYCTYIVGDDLPHPHMVEEFVSVLETEPVDFVYSDMHLVKDNGTIVRQIRLPEYDFQTSLADWFHLGVSKLYRTELHEKVGLMDEAYEGANDYDHYLRFAMAGCRFRHLAKILYSVRHHDGQRQTGQHTPARYANLLEESRQCAWRARKWFKQGPF